MDAPEVHYAKSGEVNIGYSVVGEGPFDLVFVVGWVVAHHQVVDYQGLWLFRHHASLCLLVPPDSVKSIQAVVRAYTVESLFSEAGIRALLGPRIERIIGPAYQGYLERPQFRSAPHPGVRVLSRA
jgi:hypothetical protein